MNFTKASDEILYSIAQVNAITSVAKPTIRFWEKEFKDYLNPMRTEGNQRRYTRSDIEVIERINHLVRNEGFTLEGARKKLESESAMETTSTLPNDSQLEKLADTMSDYLLKRLLAKTSA
jgi:DNA-binding transcriptional MerR regulator